MDLLAKIVAGVYIVVCVILIILVMMQDSEKGGASSAVTGGASTSFFDKNQGRTKQGMLKKLTVIFGTVFAVLTLVLGILYLKV